MSAPSRSTPIAAYVAPFGVFMGFLALDALVVSLGKGSGIWWLTEPKYWIFPLQTIICAALLLFYWRKYTMAPFRPWPWGLLAGIVVLGIWTSPQTILGFSERTDGFNPEFFGEEGSLYTMNVIARFTRFVIIVPLVEEIFWRGFLMRYLIKEDFQNVAFGTYNPLAFFGVAGLFMLVHNWPDWPAAFVTGLIYNYIAVRTKSLFACVVAHAVTNLGLGVYIMATRQWGFW